MTECRRIESLLPPYVDGDATNEVAAEVEEHLRTCPACRDQVAAERTARAVIRARAAYLVTSAPPGLATRLAATLSPSQVPRLGWRGRVTAFAAAAALVVLLVGTLELLTPRSTVLLAAQLAIDHVRCFVVERTTTAPVDPVVARQFYATSYGWQVPVPGSNAEAGIVLVAARRCPFWLGEHAHLLYRTGEHEVSLYITHDVEHQPARLAVLGYEERIWTAGGDRFAVVSRTLPAADLDRIAAHLERAIRAE